ncbi:MAG: glycosyltransferase family 87 protein [Acidobacteriaceae bacterium]
MHRNREYVAGKVASHVQIALLVYALLVVLVTAASWAVYWRSGDPLTRPLFTKADQFHDLTDHRDKIAHLRDGAVALAHGQPLFNFPPPAAYVFKIFFIFGNHAAYAYLVFIAICVLGFALVAWRAGRPSRAVRFAATVAIVTSVVLGYPMWFTADRANIESVVWAVSAAGLCLFLRKRSLGAAVLIGIAASIKPFPILLLLLLLRRRKYKDTAIGVAVLVGIVFAAFAALGPTPLQAYRDLKPVEPRYMNSYVLVLAHVDEARFEHSLLDGLKSAALMVETGGIRPHKAIGEIEKLRAEPGGWPVVRLLVRVYPFVVITGLGMLIAVFYKMPILNQVTALCVAVSLIPPVSSDYTLLQLYLPFGAFLVYLTREVAIGKAIFPYSSMLALAVIYALLFSPLTFLMVYAGDAKLLLLLALLVVAARSPMPSAYFGDPADA